MSITFDSDEHIQRFRSESDKAFLALQASCDTEMEKFLKSYGEGVSIISFQTPEMAWGNAPVPAVQASAAVRRKVKQAVAAGDRLADRAAEKIAGRKGKANTHQHPSVGGVGDLGEALRAETREAAEEARGWLKSATMDLGERAKREAAAMRDAARKAMQEETSLRGLKDRAKQELEAAKSRMKAELHDAAADAMHDLEGMAIDKLGEAQEHGFAAAEAAHRHAQRELGELMDGDDGR